MIEFEIKDLYFNWLYDKMYGSRYSPVISFLTLFAYLHSVEFTWTERMDENRAADGRSLRYQFYRETGYVDDGILDGPASVLEVMAALAIRCENQIMDNPVYGDRTKYWFWVMIKSLGLYGQTDDMFDKDRVSEAVTKFLNRDFEPDGKGSLFQTRNTTRDHRKLEIWAQMSDYLNHFNGLV